MKHALKLCKSPNIMHTIVHELKNIAMLVDEKFKRKGFISYVQWDSF